VWGGGGEKKKKITPKKKPPTTRVFKWERGWGRGNFNKGKQRSPISSAIFHHKGPEDTLPEIKWKREKKKPTGERKERKYSKKIKEGRKERGTRLCAWPAILAPVFRRSKKL